MGTPRAQLKAFERELLAGDWHQVREEVEVQWVAGPGGDDAVVLCRRAPRRAKERAMRERASRHLEADLGRLVQQVETGTLSEEAHIPRRIGRLLERYPSVAALYELAGTGPAGARHVGWRERPDRRAWCEAREGAYLLRTNLTEAEAAFRALKSERAIRPIWHQKASRVQAHTLVAFLGYALWVTLKHTLKRAGSAMSPQQALHGWRGIKSGDILLEITDGRTLRLRRVSRPDSRQQGLLDQLDLTLPERLG